MHVTPIGEDDWNVVIFECRPLVSKWRQLSGYLGLTKKKIDSIDDNHPKDNCTCWNEALSESVDSAKLFNREIWLALVEDSPKSN